MTLQNLFIVIAKFIKGNVDNPRVGFSRLKFERNKIVFILVKRFDCFCQKPQFSLFIINKAQSKTASVSKALKKSLNVGHWSNLDYPPPAPLPLSP
jgi:hypothetical protein